MKQRQAVVSDLPRLEELINSAYRGDSARSGWTHEADLVGGIRTTPEELDEILTGPDSVMLIIEDTELRKIVACVRLLRIDPNRAYLGMLTVEPILQDRGLGRRLLEHSEKWCRNAWQTRFIEMTVLDVRRELVAWYERRGYHPSGESRAFRLDPRIGVPKVEGLRFCILEKDLVSA